MSEYQKQITELDRSISEREAHMGTLQATIGRYVREHRSDLVEQRRLRTKVKEADARQKEYDEASAQAAKLEHLQNRRQELQEQITDAQAEVDRMSEEIKPLCQDVGKAAFKTYRENPFVDPAIEEIFSSLLEHEEELTELDRQIGEQESELAKRSAVAKLMSRGRLAFLKGKKSARENALPRLYREAGEAVCATNFITKVEDPSLSAAAKPYFQKRAEIEDLEQHIQSLDDEKRSVGAELTELTGNVGAERRLKKARETAENELRAIDREIGEKAASGIDGDPDLPDEVRAAVDELKTAEEAQNKERDRLRRLRAAVELEDVTESIPKIEQQISRQEQDIAERQKHLEELKQQLENAEAEKRRLEKARGSAENL
jgi:chromosome segregation ATPase